MKVLKNKWYCIVENMLSLKISTENELAIIVTKEDLKYSKRGFKCAIK